MFRSSSPAGRCTVFSFCALVAALAVGRAGCTQLITIDVMGKYGNITHGSISAAVALARSHLTANPGAEVTVYFAAGRYNVQQAGPAFALDHIPTAPGGRLTIAGAGKRATTLIFDGTDDTFSGRNVSRLTIRDLHLGRSTVTVTQVTVTKVAAGEVHLKGPVELPTPLQVFDRYSGQGRFLRRYTNSANDPHLVVDPANNGTVWPPTTNAQYPWNTATKSQVGDNVWILHLKQRDAVANYPPGALVCVKSKHGGQAFFMDGGDDIVMANILWTEHSRGVLRGGISNIAVLNCSVERQPAQGPFTPCLATNGGGPQLGQPNDPTIYNVTVDNFRAVATGDDSVAFFNVASGSATNCQIRDSYARGILLDNSPNIQLENNTLSRCPVFNTSHLSQSTPQPASR